MESTSKLSDEAPNRCDVVEDEQSPAKSAPLLLSQFVEPLTVTETFSRTARYAADPKGYLQRTLGANVYEERKHLLSIPEKVDRDVYGNGDHKAHFEQHIAKLLGKAHGLFFLTGVQTQLTALKIHCEHASNNRVAWHVSSHLEVAEEKSFKALYGLQRRFLGSDRDANPTVDEFKEVLDLPSDERPAVIVLEIPNRVLGCKTYTFDDLETISNACKKAGVKFHCDGARLWEIEPNYQKTVGKSFAELAGLFDTVYVSFYKGLRGATGAMLASNDEQLMKEAKMWQRRAGGNAYTLTYEVVDCERGYNEQIGTFKRKWDKMAEVVREVTAATERYKTTDGEPIVRFLPEEATCCQIHTFFQGYTADELTAARDRVQEERNIRVFDKVWPKKTHDEKAKAEREAKADVNGDEVNNADQDRQHMIEWMIVPALEKVETKVFVDAYVELCEQLTAEAKGRGKANGRPE